MAENAGAVIPGITAEQRRYAKLAGAFYLLNYGLNFLGEGLAAGIRGSGSFLEVAHNVAASEVLYRVALSSTALAWITVVPLAYALWVVLEPVNRRLALLALLMRLGEAFVGAASVMFSMASARIYESIGMSQFSDEHLRVLVAASQRAMAAGFEIAMLFVSIGSILFFELFRRSGYLPQAFARFAVLASSLLFVVTLAMFVFPRYSSMLQVGWAPMFIAEIVTATWLLVKGLPRPPAG